MVIVEKKNELIKKKVGPRFFICNKGSITDLEEIYSISQPLEGYGEHEGQWRFKALSKLDGKPLDFIYENEGECRSDQIKMALQLVDYRGGFVD